MLDSSQKELLDLVMNFVDDAHKHKIDEVRIEQSLTDILETIQDLAMEVEEGAWERDGEN